MSDRMGSERRSDPEELFADAFAGFLLMPKKAVLRGLGDRGLDPCVLNATDAYRLSSWLGVGYSALVHHARWNLDLFSAAHAGELRKATPKKLKKMYVGSDEGDELLVVDKQWIERSVDLRCNDLILAPAGYRTEGSSIEQIGQTLDGEIFRASMPGACRLVSSDECKAVFVRVSRYGYEGFARFRHLEEVNEEDD